MTDLQIHRHRGIIRVSKWGWVGINEWKGREYCRPEHRWAFWKQKTLIRFTIDIFTFNLWMPWALK